MAKNIKELLDEVDSLGKENAALKIKLKEAKESIDSIQTGSIDALVIAHENALKVYTENTADKPYRILIENMHEGAVTLYEDRTILYCNSYFSNMVNLPLQKVIGTLFVNYIEDASRDKVNALLKKGSVNPSKEEINIYTRDGKKIPVLMTVNALSLGNVFILGIILTDLTILNENKEKIWRRTLQLEQQNEKLESANNQLALQIEETKKRGAELSIAKTDVKELEGLNTHKENILATLSHDLRSPLTGIIGMADLLNESYESLDPGTIKELIGHINKASTDELSMLDYLVEWARIKYASEAFSPAEIKLGHYAGQVFERLNGNAAAKNLHLDNKIEENINVFADRKMLLSIFQNLVSNAIKYTPDGGKIIISAKRNEDKIIVEVKDNGIGMPEKIKEQLFTPQMTSLSQAREDNKGAGIGLLLVKGFIEKIGGEIWVESTEGVGSSFYFTLPVIKPLDKN
jgi:PAS domain S-box-containing protein